MGPETYRIHVREMGDRTGLSAVVYGDDDELVEESAEKPQATVQEVTADVTTN